MYLHYLIPYQVQVNGLLRLIPKTNKNKNKNKQIKIKINK